MRRYRSWLAVLLVLACASHAGAQTAPPASASPALPAAQQCDVERVALQAQVVELRARVVELQTQLDRLALERERARVEATLTIPAGHRWDWQTLQLVPVAPEAPRP